MKQEADIPNPIVSVLMCVCNEEKWISLAINSILGQTLSDFEFIITDDGSTDATFDIISGFRKDKRIRIIRHDTRRGLATSLNEQIKNARGRYIARMDGDDISDQNRLKEQVDFLATHPKTGLLGSYCREIDSLGKPIGIWKRPVSNALLQQAILRSNPFIHSSVMIPCEIFSKAGYYNEQRAYAQDYDLWLRVSRYYELANIPEPLVDLRVDWKKMNRKNHEARKCEFEILKDHIYSGPFPAHYHLYLIRPLILSILPTELMMRLKELQRNYRKGFFSTA